MGKDGLQPGRLDAGPDTPLVAHVGPSDPGFLLGTDSDGAPRAPLALAGIVPVRVTDEGGPTAAGISS